MEHFVAYESGGSSAVSFETKGRLLVQSRKHGHLLRALNNKVWLVRGTREGDGIRYELRGVYIAATISETTSGEFLIDGTDGLDFEPPIALNKIPWFDLVRNARSNLRTGFNRITDQSIIDHLLEIEHRSRVSRGRRSRREMTGDIPRGKTTTSVGRRKEASLAQQEHAAVQNRAMICALEYYRLRWKNVADVSSREAYDIHCDNPKGRVLAVTVKGTTGVWENLFLTAAEERHAREAFPDNALFILHDVGVVESTNGELLGRGGTTHVIDPWDIAIDDVSPLIFGCRLSRTRGAKHGVK